LVAFDAAPWAPKMKVATVLAVAVCAAILGSSWGVLPGKPMAVAGWMYLLVVLPPIAVAIALFFVVRGYELQADRLEVRRFLWSTRVPLDGLQHAWHDPRAMDRSMRLLGNSGLFSISGLFQGREIGRYRAFVTNPRQAVVLRAGKRTVVVSPANPQAFLDALARRHPSMTLGKP
jgi:hypothetical protein